MTVVTESGHWYFCDGTPAYTIIGKNGVKRNTTLRDAKKLRLLPSVTTIIRCCDKPALINWKIDQVLMAALTLLRKEDETDSEYCDRIKNDASEQARKAAQRGTQIHAWIEKGLLGEELPDEGKQFYLLAQKELAPLKQNWIPEKSFAGMDYGGKADLHSIEYVIDIKTNEKPVAKATLYDEHYMQLAACCDGLTLPLDTTKCGILFVNHKDMESRLLFAERDEINRGWEMFKALKNYYYSKNRL